MAYMDVMKSLGPNKVTMSIRSNSFEESIAFHVTNAAKNTYHLMNPLAVIRSMKRDKPSIPNTPQSIPMSPYYSILYSILCHIDPLVSLLGSDDIQKKVVFFKDQIKNTSALPPKVRNKINLEDEEATLCLLSRVLSKNIMVMMRDSSKCAQFHYVDDDVEVIVLYLDATGKYELDTGAAHMTIKECVLKCTAGYETMLVKDLKKVAKMLGVTKSTKPELVSAIKSKIDSYI